MPWESKNNLLLVVGGKIYKSKSQSLRLFSLGCDLQSLNVLLLLEPRFLSVALTCFSSLCRGLNAKWWGDKTLSIKTCFMTTWDSWLVLQHENSGGFEAKVSLRDLTVSLTRLPKACGILAQHSRLLSWQKSIKRYSALGRHTHSWVTPN